MKAMNLYYCIRMIEAFAGMSSIEVPYIIRATIYWLWGY